MKVTFCDKCGGVHLGEARCHPYEVWKGYALDDEAPRTVWAVGPEEAACAWARRYDYESGEPASCNTTVFVRKRVTGAPTETFRVTVVIEPEYRAERIA